MEWVVALVVAVAVLAIVLWLLPGLVVFVHFLVAEPEIGLPFAVLLGSIVFGFAVWGPLGAGAVFVTWLLVALVAGRSRGAGPAPLDRG